MFFALFPIAKLWNQPGYLSPDEWIKNSVVFYIATKTNEIMSFPGKWTDHHVK